MAHIIIGRDDTCTCSADSKCVLGRIGSENRCTKAELVANNYGTVKLTKNFWGKIKLAVRVKYINV